MRDQIEFKVPADFENISEVMFSAVDNNAAPNTQEIYANNAKSNILGTLSLHLNNRDSHPLNLRVQVKSHSAKKRKYEGLKLESDLAGNTRVQGYYIDAGYATRYPYDLNIYMAGTHSIPLRANV